MGVIIESHFELVQRPLVMPVCWELGKGHVKSLAFEMISEGAILVQRPKTEDCHFCVYI